MRGRVTDADSVPVPEARVLLFDARTEELLRDVEAQADGTFELTDPGRPAIVLAAYHTAVGASEKIVHERQGVGDVGDVLLRRGARLGGILLLPDETPMAAVSIRADPVDDDRHFFGRSLVDHDRLPRGVTSTGEDGRFLFRGLLPGTYGLRAKLWRRYGPLEGRHPTGQESLRFVLERYELRIRSSSSTGAELHRVRASARSWLDAPPELVHAVGGGFGNLEEWSHLQERSRLWKETTEVLRTEPGELFRVDVLASGHEPASGVLHVREGDYVSELEVVLDPSAEVPCTGNLRLSIPGLVQDRLRVRLDVERSDGTPVLRRDVHPSLKPRKLNRRLGFESRCGWYRIEARCIGSGGEHLQVFRADFELRAGRETRLPLLFDGAGHVTVDVALPRPAHGARHREGTCVLRSGRELPVATTTFPLRGRGRSRQLSFPSLAPGPYQVSLRIGDGTAVVENVDVRAGRTHRLAVDLSDHGASGPQAR